jgi:hypothetical protein
MGSQKNTDFSKRTRKTKPEYYQGLAVGDKLNIRSKKIVEPIASKRPLSQFLIVIDRIQITV